MNWANRITIARILLIPAFVLTVLKYESSLGPGGPNEVLRWTALTLFVVAALSDAVDGYLARHCGQATRLGAILDPLADKLLMLSALIVLGFLPLKTLPTYPFWFSGMILGRDAVLILGFVILRTRGISFDVIPHWTGKVSTFFQLTAVIGILLKSPGLYLIFISGAFFTVASTYIYFSQGLALFSNLDRAKMDSSSS